MTAVWGQTAWLPLEKESVGCQVDMKMLPEPVQIFQHAVERMA